MASKSKSRSKVQPTNPVLRQTLINIAELEERALKSLDSGLEFAKWEIEREAKECKVQAQEYEQDTKQDGVKLDQSKLLERWVPGDYFAGQVFRHLSDGVESLKRTVENNAKITEEYALAKAVAAFHKAIPKEGSWVLGEGEKPFQDALEAIAVARYLVPKGLTKRSDLAKLRDCFESISDVVKAMTGKAVAVPSVPNALDPEDPRQMTFDFL
jgi:hypothetical protein